MTIEEKKRINAAFKDLQTNVSRLSESARYFVHSLKKYHTRYKRLSEKQQRALFEVRDSIQVEADTSRVSKNKNDQYE